MAGADGDGVSPLGAAWDSGVAVGAGTPTPKA